MSLSLDFQKNFVNSSDIHLLNPLTLDDWGVLSNAADFRYHHQLTRRQHLEPYVRVYRQSAADFNSRKLAVNEQLIPVLPVDGLASAVYRLDALTSTTLGVKYGIAISSNTDFRVRAEYINQIFDTADYDTNTAMVVQTSLKYKF